MTHIAQLAKDVVDTMRSQEFEEVYEAPTSLWDIIEYGVGSYETRISRFIRWLMDPSAAHGLGASFLNDFVQEALEPRSGYRPESAQGVCADLAGGFVDVTDWRVTAETPANIDVFAYSESRNICIVVENKTGAPETYGHDKSQLQKYVEYLEGSTEYRDSVRLFVFLTDDGHLPDAVAAEEDPEMAPEWARQWIPLSHRDLSDLYQRAFERSQDSEESDSTSPGIIEDFLRHENRRLGEGLDTHRVAAALFGREAFAANPYKDSYPQLISFLRLGIALGAVGFDGGSVDETARGLKDPYTKAFRVAAESPATSSEIDAFARAIADIDGQDQAHEVPARAVTAMRAIWEARPRETPVQRFVRDLFELMGEGERHYLGNGAWRLEARSELGPLISHVHLKRPSGSSRGLNVYLTEMEENRLFFQGAGAGSFAKVTNFPGELEDPRARAYNMKRKGLCRQVSEWGDPRAFLKRVIEVLGEAGFDISGVSIPEMD